jgi:hypothetical protein
MHDEKYLFKKKTFLNKVGEFPLRPTVRTNEYSSQVWYNGGLGHACLGIISYLCIVTLLSWKENVNG